MNEEERNLKQKKREKEVKRLKGFIFGSALLLGAGGIGYKIYDYMHTLSVTKIDREIDIHTNNYEIDGHRIDAFTEHDCEFEGEGDFVDRMADKMRDSGYSEESIKAAVKKFDLKYEHDLEEANKIDIGAINKQSKTR